MQLAHVQLVHTGSSGQLLVVGLIFGLDRVVLGDLQALVSLHTTVANILRAVNAPRRGHRTIGAAAALDARRSGALLTFASQTQKSDPIATVSGGALLNEELVVHDELLLRRIVAYRTMDQWWQGTVQL